MLCAALSVGLLSACGTGPVTLDPPGGLAAAQREVCEDLVAALPDEVAGLERREVDPADALGAAWGDPAIELTCGVGRPADYDAANGCTTVNGVDWYIPREQLEGNGELDLTMTTIKREVGVEVVLPGEHWPPATTLADLSEAISEHTDATGRCR